MKSTGDWDVVIVGGGPGGATTGTLLRKYNPNLRVLILEREVFPRDHIGESQLPPIGRILNEMGVWEKIEAAGFPVKLGATYTWGKTTEPWVFRFIPDSEAKNEARPGKYEGWRTRVAFQVDRAIYDDILLKHAEEMGCEVRQGTKVTGVESEETKSGKKVTALTLEDGERITARYYVDASGNAAVIRRGLDIKVDAPSLLRNIAFWDYWERPGLNVPLLESNAVRIIIRSLPYGWLWYIALSNDRTSVGLVCNAEYYKHAGKRPEQMLLDGISQQGQISNLLKDASRRGKVESTTDWSYVAERAYGPNWFLCGECLGFADPILSAGMTLTHTCAEHLACTILELDRRELDATWLRSQYESIQRKRVQQHIRFAEYWYAGNGLFEAVVENCAAIAKSSGLVLAPDEAFHWLSTGGVDDHAGQFVIGGLGLSGVKSVQKRLMHSKQGEVRYAINGATHVKLNILGAKQMFGAEPRLGRIDRIPVIERGSARLVLTRHYADLVDVLKQFSAVPEIFNELKKRAMKKYGPSQATPVLTQTLQAMEVLVAQGWAIVEKRPGATAISMETPDEGEIVYTEKLGPKSTRKK